MHEKLEVVPQGARELVITRGFAAPRSRVFEAWTTPELLQRWLGVQGGWSLAVCEIDLRVGGRYRFVWQQGPGGPTMGVGGVYLEIEAPARLVQTEQFDEPWYPGEALIQASLTERDGCTTMALTIRYESSAARDGVLHSPMKEGLAAGYDKLAELLA